mgnify:CR=1 FL=1
MRSLLLVLLFFLAAVPNARMLSLLQAQDQLPELVRRIKPSAVAIETFDARSESFRAAAASSLTSTASSPTATLSTMLSARKSIRTTAPVYPVKGVIAVDAEG